MTELDKGSIMEIINYTALPILIDLNNIDIVKTIPEDSVNNSTLDITFKSGKKLSIDFRRETEMAKCYRLIKESITILGITSFKERM